MRQVTQDEADAWTELAREHGFTDRPGDFGLGRFLAVAG